MNNEPARLTRRLSRRAPRNLVRVTCADCGKNHLDALIHGDTAAVKLFRHSGVLSAADTVHVACACGRQTTFQLQELAAYANRTGERRWYL